MIEIDKRLAVLEVRFESIDYRIANLEAEVKHIRQEIAALNQRMEQNEDQRRIIHELTARVQKLEEKLAA